jgi:DNA-binding beta-propeller fold protein YncE
VQFVWQTTGGAQPFVNPHPIAIDPHGTLWVTDARGQFQLFDLDGTYLETWGTPGSGDGQFNFVRPNGDAYGGVAFGQDGALYVVDTGNLRVQKFDRDRTFVASWGGQGSGDGQFLDPLSIAIDGQGMLYVLDDLRDDVQVFDGDGVYLRKFRVHEALGLTAGQSNSCNQLTVDGAGNVYVTSFLYTSALKFDPSGAFVGQIGEFGSGVGQFQQPDGIAVDPAGNLFVTDANAGRVEVFAPDGTALAQWGSPGTGTGQFSAPAGVAVRGPNVYVAEYSGNRVQKFRLLPPLGPA